ncbi:hypothetical protein ADIARSV_1888 [Arcticibacter svalbardensis MN12-7]|uniref:DUF2851 domain-containing protein n=1 Tax=Arcticibacter svalbardensis MN12-7 TaxID=1150600 RepID=R9GST5_9SPHI|nr:DUF2851 family protein [Arcticibacter svalbardensis]EOR94927.1 hypothetical protein ADIARSV_1888 [Arcticibacter svalbardensis MN12-7]
MNEDFINFVWKYRLFNQKLLCTTKGETIEIISPGLSNSHAGPDFVDVHVRIGSTTWVGSAEIHIRTSDWERHEHTRDKAYNNVILHVVYENDCNAFREDGTEPSVLEIKPYINENIESRYHLLIENMTWIPCEKQLALVDPVHVQSCLQRMLAERLEEKSNAVYTLLEENKGDWSQTFYVLLARNFGFKLNALPFELVARSLTSKILERHKTSPFQLEALIFGQAGFLEEPAEDEYIGTLQKEYQYLKHKYQLHPIDSYLWKYLRLRPQNFPAIRLSQFAALLHHSTQLFSKLLDARDAKEIKALFSSVNVSPYWQTHNKPGKSCRPGALSLGKESIVNILINTVSVLLFSYGKYISNEEISNRALDLLENIPAETNHIILRYRQLGVKALGADSSQALLQLKKIYCDRKKCLNCAIGARIINSA